MNKLFNCPVEITSSVLGGKWKSRILWELRLKPCRFSELQRQIPSVTKKVLSQALSELEGNHLLTRTIYPGNVIKVEYQLTRYGIETLSLIQMMSKWGEEHFYLLENQNAEWG